MLFEQDARKGIFGIKYWLLLLSVVTASIGGAGRLCGQAAEVEAEDEQLLSLKHIYQTTKPLFADTGRQVIKLTLQECIRQGLAHNLDMRVGGYEPAMRMSDLVSAEAAFDAVLFGSSQMNVTDRANIDSGYYTRTIITDNGTRDVRMGNSPFLASHDYNYMLGLRKLLPTGASVQLAQQLRRLRDLTDEDQQLFRNPFYEFGLQFQLRQPLLRDFGIDVNRANILASRNNYRISQQQFHLLVIRTVAEVESNYWNLFFARQRVKIFAGLIERSKMTFERIQQRKDYDGKSLVIARTLAAIKGAEADLLSSRNLVLQQQTLLLDSINSPELSLKEQLEIIPEDQPSMVWYEVDRDGAVDTALQKRPEIISQRLRVDTAELAQGVAQNQTLPRLDMVYQQEMTGPGDQYHSSWDQQWQNETTNYVFGLSFEVPFGNRAAEAALSRARNRQQQEKLNLESLRQQVLADVSISLDKLDSSYKEIGKRIETVEAEQDVLVNHLAMQDAGRQDTMTPEFLNLKLNSDQRLASSQIVAVQAMIQYNLAIMDAYRAQGTLLRYNNIKLAEFVEGVE